MLDYTVTSRDEFLIAEFRAMASPCELIVDSQSHIILNVAADIAYREALRIENTFSRYLDNNVIARINNANGEPVEVDDETANLLDFAHQCFEISDGLFDITSGVLRRAWRFDDKQQLPKKSDTDALLPLVGWQKVTWKRPSITLPTGMQLDFGGIGKEYAVDRTVNLIKNAIDCAFLVNYGGDLHASEAPSRGKPWSIGIEHYQHGGQAVSAIQLLRGALTTSGDTYRFIQKEGIRYGHVLHPATGWPVADAPHSVSVMSNTCTEAGILSTLAMLQGKNAEQFLRKQEVKFWCQR